MYIILFSRNIGECVFWRPLELESDPYPIRTVHGDYLWDCLLIALRLWTWPL